MNTKSVEHAELEHDAGVSSINGPGGRLRYAREQAKLTRADVALHLHLRHCVIEAIEQDNYAKMPDFVFVRGYLRAYANLLELPADDIVLQFNEIHAHDPNLVRKATANNMKYRKPERKNRLVRWLTYVIILGLVVGAAMWWHSQQADKDLLLGLVPADADEHVWVDDEGSFISADEYSVLGLNNATSMHEVPEEFILLA